MGCSRCCRTLFYVRPLDDVGDLTLIDDLDPFYDFAEDGVLRVPLGVRLDVNEELAVSSTRIGPGVRHRDGAPDMVPLFRDLGGADRLAARRASPVVLHLHVAGLRIADLND